MTKPSKAQVDYYAGYFFRFATIGLLGLCSFFLKDWATEYGDFKKDVQHLKEDFSGFRGEFKEFRAGIIRFQNLKELEDYERFKQLKQATDQLTDEDGEKKPGP